MLGLDSAGWRRLSPLLDAALELPAAERARWLDTLEGRDRELRPLLERLLAEQPTAWPALFPRGPAAGDRVGPYRLVAPLGHGGMGEVWRAVRADGLLQREVALKLPQAEGPAARLARRMARERDMLAALVHPNIARLYDAGLDEEGRPFMALELVEGERIDQWAERQGADLRTRVRLVLQAARAVAHAHAQLIVHRDIKPSNLLVDGAGQVKLLDFGIAKLVDDDTAPGITEQGAPRPMTPGYASPEQLAGAPVGTRSDVYSLAVVMFELVTGRSPHRPADGSRRALEDAVLQATPLRASDAVSDRRLARRLRGDLDLLLACALERSPADRYPSADAFAADLARWLDGRPLLVRPQPWRVQLARFVRRHRLVVAAGSFTLAAVVAGALAAGWQARVANREREQAQQVKDFVVGLLSETSPYRGRAPQQLNAVDLVHRAFDRFKASTIESPEVRLELLAMMAETLTTMGDPDTAEQVNALAQAEAQRLPGRPEAEVTVGLGRAQQLRLRGRPQEAFDLLDRLLEPARRAARRQPLLEVMVQQQLSLNLQDLGRHDEQVRAAAEAVRLARARLGERNEETIASTTGLAMARLYAGRQADAQAAAEDAHRAALAALGADHLRTIEAQTILGRTLGERGDFARAASLLEASVTSLRRQIGPDAILVAMTQNNLATVLVEQGRLKAAVDAARDAQRIVRLHSAPESFNQAAVAATLGDALAAAHDDAAALAQLRPAAATLARLLGPAHERTLRTQATLALVLARSGFTAEAQRLLDEVAALLEAAPPLARLRAARAGAAAALHAGRAGEALQRLQPLLAAADAAPRLRHEQALAQVEAAQAALAAGQVGDALARFGSALAALQALEAEPTPARAAAAAGLARAR